MLPNGSPGRLIILYFDREVGDSVEVVIYRAGQQYRVELTLSEQKG